MRYVTDGNEGLSAQREFPFRSGLAIGEFAVHQTRGSAEGMQLDLVRAQDVPNRVIGGFQIICDQRAMALPPECFGTHDGSALCFRELEQSFNASAKSFRAHVISVATEGFVSPGSVRRIGQRRA